MSAQGTHPPHGYQRRGFHRFDTPPKLPDGYLQHGYYDQNGIPFKELFVDWPKEIALNFKKQKPRMTQSSIRNFYNEVKTIAGLVRADEARFEENLVRLHKLPSLVHYAVYKKESNLPELFLEFVEKNYPEAQKSREHLKLFADHFMCVIAYLK